MWDLEALKEHRDIIDQIDWSMTPEKAVETYLEWGTGWARKDDFVRYPDQESYYFVIYDWEDPLRLTLLKRNSQEAIEIAKISAPSELIVKSIKEAGTKPGVGVCALNDELIEWARKTLGC